MHTKWAIVLADYVIRGWSRLKMLRKRRAGRSYYKVNAGCGPSALPGWVNLDNSPNLALSKIPYCRSLLRRLRLLTDAQANLLWPPYIEVHDVREGLPFADETVDFIYSSHFLEHLTREEGYRFVKECYRVLKPGGVIRLVLPDLQVLIDRYYVTRDADEFMEALSMSGVGREPHRWLYDFYSLTRLLERCGFVEVKRVSEGQGDVPGANKLDVRHGEHHLRVEAKKPTLVRQVQQVEH